jgi:hypothetical protein
LRINPQQLLGDERKGPGVKAERGIRHNANVFAWKVTGQQSAGGRADTDDADVDFLRGELLPFLLVEKDETAVVAADFDRFGAHRGRRDDEDNR